MYTVEEIAQQIEALKPDFKEFIKLLKEGDSSLSHHVTNTQNIYEKLFKAQLVLITNTTHAKRYTWGETDRPFSELLYNHVSNASVSIRTGYNGKTNYKLQNYTIKDQFHSSHIAAHIKDVKPYLTPYLWNKVRIKSDRKLDFKELKPDLMALTIFSNHLSTLKKKLPSTQISTYIDQVRKFPEDIQQKYLGVLLGHSAPSLALQSKLTNFLPSSNSNEVKDFMFLNKYHIRRTANNLGIPTSSSIFDDKHSEYKPFITNVKRKPTTDLAQFTYLFNTVLVLKTSCKQKPNPVYEFFIEQISEHLKDPDYDEVRTKYLGSINLLVDSIEEVKDGFI